MVPRSRSWAGLTIHQLLLFQWYRESSLLSFEVNGQNMESSTPVVTFNCRSSGQMLHRKVVSDGARTIAYEVGGLVHSISRE